MTEINICLSIILALLSSICWRGVTGSLFGVQITHDVVSVGLNKVRDVLPEKPNVSILLGNRSVDLRCLLR